MAITDDLLALAEKNKQTPVAQSPSWVKELIDKRYQAKTERLKRTPVGFDFEREPFDPSSYYKQLGQFRDISRLATGVTKQEVANREEAERQREYEANQAAMKNALSGVSANYTYDGVSRKYGLKGVTSNTAKAADYWGSKYGISNVYGYREHGSVPGSDHPKGLALDYMTKNKSQGTALANDLIANYKAWNVKYVIWNRYIWNPSAGWHKYNGPSAHTDHVHVSFNK